MSAASRQAQRAPACIFHQASGQAIVKLGGRAVYLGAWGTEEAQASYQRVVAEWQASGRVLRPGAEVVTVNQVIAGFWQHAQVYYRKDGKPTTEQMALRQALRVPHQLYGPTPAHEFGPLALKACREVLIGKGLARNTINGYVSRIRQAFRWAVENELVAGDVLEALRAVPGLKRGRSLAKEPEPVRPVSEHDVQAVLPFVSRQVAAMVRLQWLTGMRPGEVVQMRMGDLDRAGRVWIYRPERHKLEHQGIERVIPIGPQAQAVLAPFLRLERSTSLFSPQEAERERRAAMRTARKTKVWPSHSTAAKRRRLGWGPSQLGETYDNASYRRAVDRACKAAGISSWSPNQLRHSAATRIRKEMGLEVAQAVLGHRQLETTQVYAEINVARAVEAMERLG